MCRLVLKVLRSKVINVLFCIYYNIEIMNKATFRDRDTVQNKKNYVTGGISVAPICFEYLFHRINSLSLYSIALNTTFSGMASMERGKVE